MDQNAGHLRLLSIFHHVVGGLAACFSRFFIIHIAPFGTVPGIFTIPVLPRPRVKEMLNAPAAA